MWLRDYFCVLQDDVWNNHSVAIGYTTSDRCDHFTCEGLRLVGEDAHEHGRVKVIPHAGLILSADFKDSRIEAMSCGPSTFLVMALSQSPAHTGDAVSCS